jgi:hypothetical protein
MTQTQHDALPATPAAGEQASDDLADRYARYGYVIVPRALTLAEVGELRAEALRICRGDLGPVAGMEPARPMKPTRRSSAGTPASTSRTNCRR